MAIQVIQIGLMQVTNSVANGTTVDLADAAQLEAGPSFNGQGAGNSVLVFELDPGSTPGAFDIAVLESSDDSTWTAITGAAIDEAVSAVRTVVMRNVTISKRYIRLEVEEATANAGTVSAWLISS